MIISKLIWFVVCDGCLKQVQTNAANAEIAEQTVLRQGRVRNGYSHYCPECIKKGVKML